jgi:CBS domain-containing protein
MPRRLAPLRVRDVLTRDVVSVAPGTSVKTAAGILADRGFAALPVVDDEHRLVGIVGEADVLRGRLLPDPRLRLRRDVGTGAAAPPVHVGGVMTTDVRTVEAGADVAEVARLLVDERLRSVPVVDGGRLVGIVSRQDVLRALARPDDQLRGDLLRRIADYAGRLDGWQVAVREGVATVRRPRGGPGSDDDALRTLARTVPGVVAMRVIPAC